ncbi:porin [Agitococcus lubricus]|nr:porin [Agitococcus lubricus]
MNKWPLLLSSLALSSVACADNTHAVAAASYFNPQMSLILNGYYYHDNQRGAANERIEEMAGIGHTVHDPHAHAHGGIEQGFNLAESELVLSATVDPYFDGKFIMTVDGQGQTAVEEAWLQTRLLPAGLKAKMGKFLSEIGYLNNQHPHTWDFADQNLAYRALLGDHGLMDSGIQLTWLAPTPFYSLWGIEALQGSNQERFGALVDEELIHETLDENTIQGDMSPSRAGPRIYTAFAKFAPNLGDNHALQIGLSYAQAKQYQQVLDEDGLSLSGDEMALNGKQQLIATDIVYKWDTAGDYGQGDLKVIAEYLRLNKDMTVVATGAGVDTDGDTLIDSFPAAIGEKVTGKQDGYTLQLAYGIAPRWQLAWRHDATGNLNELTSAGSTESFAKSTRHSVSLSFFASEYSRLRLQASQADIADEAGDSEQVKQIFLQYTHSLGAHGAHKF